MCAYSSSINEKYKSLLKQAHRSLAYWTQIAKVDFTDDLPARSPRAGDGCFLSFPIQSTSL
jgi:hypothetical protein